MYAPCNGVIFSAQHFVLQFKVGSHKKQSRNEKLFTLRRLYCRSFLSTITSEIDFLLSLSACREAFSEERRFLVSHMNRNLLWQ